MPNEDTTLLKILFKNTGASSQPSVSQSRVDFIKLSYLTALIILAGLALIGYVVLRQATIDQDINSELISVSKTQRTLSQSIALTAARLVNASDSIDGETLRTQLSDLIQQMSAVHMILMTGLLPDNRSYAMSETIKDLYFNDPLPLDASFQSYLSLASRLSTAFASDLTPENTDFKALLEASPLLLDVLDKVDAQYKLENQARIVQLERNEAIFLTTTLGVLGLITVFIFYPMERRIRTEQQHLLTEIDMRREVEHTLLRSEALYRLLTQNLPNTAVLLFDQDMRYLLVEGAILDQAGYNKHQMEGKTIYEVLPPDTIQRVLPIYQSALKGVAWDYEYGGPLGKTYHIHSVPIKDDRDYIAGGILSIQDITQQKLAEQKLDEHEAFMEQVLKGIPDFIYIFDVDLQQNVFVSGTLGDMLGYTPEEFYAAGGQFLPNLVHTEDVAQLNKQYEDLMTQLDGSDPLNVEVRLHHANGAWRWFSTRTQVFKRHPDGRVSQVIGMSHDIEQRKQVENALRDRELFIQQIAATVPDIIYIYDLQSWSNVYANRPFGEAIGYDSESIRALGNDFMSNTMHPDDWVRFPQHFANLSAAPQDTMLEFEYRMKVPNGSWLWLNSRDIVFRRDPDGHVTQVLGVARDITERKNDEQARQESEDRFRQIAETVSSAFWIISSDGRETSYVSPSYETIWGRPPMEMYKDPLAFARSIHPEDQDRVLEERNVSLWRGAYNLEYRILRPDGATRWVESRTYPIVNKEGQIERLISVSDDITERKELETHEFAIALEREHSRMLASFVRDTSHDLRTPLTIITTGLYLLRRITDPEKQGERIDLIEKQVQNLNQIISDLHAMSDLDTASHLDLELIDINQILRDLSVGYFKTSADKAQTLLLNLQSDVPVIQADPERIKDALGKVIDNAIVYTEPGGTITIDASTNESHVVISVTDTGIGIPPEHVGRIFDRFYKVNFARTSGQSGPGLGLSIVKKIAEMHHGRIDVESTLDSGSVFRLYLPLNPID